jgi:glycosyltransferase involved in cell wall biosynthesis
MRQTTDTTVSLLITTYKRTDALNLVLETVIKQTVMPLEIIICDDGSDSQTRDLILAWSARLPMKHVWQPDSDFRASRSRNLGVAKSLAKYLIFLDGDCLLPPFFIERHLKLASRGFLVSGGRRLLSPEKTRSLFENALSLPTAFNHWKFFGFPMGLLRDLGPAEWESVRTCNIGMYREDALMIAGFDESFVGWGREDSDFVVRLIHSGVKIRSGRLAACVAHLYHPESPRDHLSVNDQRFRETLNNPNHVMATSSILYS